MFLQRTIEVARFSKNGVKFKRSTIHYVFKCDECGLEYSKRSTKRRVANCLVTYCGNACKFKARKKRKLSEAQVQHITRVRNLPEYRQHMSDLLKGRPKTIEHCKKLREAKLYGSSGRKRSINVVQKLKQFKNGAT